VYCFYYFEFLFYVLIFVTYTPVIGSAGAWSMKWYGVRLSACLSVCPIIHPPHAAAAGLLLWARRFWALPVVKAARRWLRLTGEV